MVINIRKLRTSALLGVYEHERLARREIIVNARIEYESALAVANDSIEHALDYEQVSAAIIDVVSTVLSSPTPNDSNNILPEPPPD